MHEIKEHKDYAGPVIMLSAFPGYWIHWNYGADMFIAKPFDIAD